MKKQDILYGKNNEKYNIKAIEDNTITVSYCKKIIIKYNVNNEEKIEYKEECLKFGEHEIGTRIFLKKDDGKKSAQELLEDNDYIDYKENLYKRIEKEEKAKKEQEEYIKKFAPEIKMSPKEKDLKLIEYENKEISMKEEQNFYNMVNESYFARMDVNTKYYNEDYYERYYISKETVSQENDCGQIIEGTYYTYNDLKEMNKNAFIKKNKITSGINKDYGKGIHLIHWTAPIANLYYNKENNSVLKSNEYMYKAMLKRNFMFNPLRFVNTFIENNTFYKEGVVDEFLLSILLEKRASDELTDIIYTIQSNQNSIIRTHEKENFIVQGCAGSGKTMILLHRLSYLKFNDKLPEYSKIKIITPNKIFNDFIHKLSNDLDISEIEQITISNYYLRINNLYIQRYNKIEAVEGLKEIINSKTNKYKRVFEANKMYDENQLEEKQIKNLYKEDIFKFIQKEYNKKIDDMKQKIKNLKIFDENILGNNAAYFERFLYKTSQELKKLENEKNISIESVKQKQEEYNKQKNKTLFNRVINIISSNNKEKHLEKEIAKLQSNIEQLDKKIKDMKDVQIEILNNVYFTIDIYEEIIKDVMNKTNIVIPKGKFIRAELLIFMYINFLHFGQLLNGDKLLCFDEAQDYNLLEYKIIRMVNKDVVMNLYGDVNQSFYIKGITDWRDLIESLQFKQYFLNENYRNTIKITEFCNEKFKYNILSMGLDGKNVEFIDEYKIKDIVYRKINEQRKVAIICKNEEELNSIEDKIENQYVIYSSIEKAKGIEYDTVIVKDYNMNNNQKYIAYTRALNELYICS